jgi:hypothetical protein
MAFISQKCFIFEIFCRVQVEKIVILGCYLLDVIILHPT